VPPGAAEVWAKAVPQLARRGCLLRRFPCEMLAFTIGFILWRGGASAPPGRSGSAGGRARQLSRLIAHSAKAIL
jgi:hypothetical protein